MIICVCTCVCICVYKWSTTLMMLRFYRSKMSIIYIYIYIHIYMQSWKQCVLLVITTIALLQPTHALRQMMCPSSWAITIAVITRTAHCFHDYIYCTYIYREREEEATEIAAKYLQNKICFKLRRRYIYIYIYL